MATFREWRKRVGAGIAAGLFLITSLALSFLVVVQIRKDNEENKLNAGIQEALKAQASSNKENKLEGTILTDFTPVATVDSLQSTDLVEGTGEVVKATDTVTAHYTGALAKDGTIFESSLDSGQPATFPLSGVIKGWQEGVPGMKVGGKRRLVIPASLAYGERGSAPKIGPNEPLVFDIEMVSVKAQ